MGHSLKSRMAASPPHSRMRTADGTGFRRKLLASRDNEKLKSMLEEISRMLSGLINTLENQEAFPLRK